MTENVENLILEMLRAVRADVAAMKSELKENTTRLGRIESGVARIARDEGQNYSEMVEDRHAVDKLKERIERIEQRLELS